MTKKTDDGRNIMQRIYDALAAEPDSTAEAIAGDLKLDADVVRSGIQRLRLERLVSSTCRDGLWTYSLRPGAERPLDRRGRKPKLAA